MTNTALESFIATFLKAPKGDSPEQVEARIRYWIDVANSPEEFVGDDDSPHAISAKRRSARQNLRRLLRKHPLVAEQIMRQSEAQQ